MKIILDGQLSIRIVPEQSTVRRAAPFTGRTWQEARRHAASVDPVAGRARSFESREYESGEVALFEVLLFLLRCYKEGTGKIPTHEVLTAVVRTLEELLNTGRLPPPGGWDQAFLTLLATALKQIAARHDAHWLDELSAEIRARAEALNNPRDGDDDDGGGGDGDGSGSGGAGSVGSGSRGHRAGAARGGKGPSKGNGVPTRRNTPRRNGQGGSGLGAPTDPCGSSR